MPKLVNKLPAYGHHKASGQARVKHNGRSIYPGEFGSVESKEADARFIAGLPKPEEQPALAEPASGVALTVGEIVLRFYRHALTYYVDVDGKQTGEADTIKHADRIRRKMSCFGQGRFERRVRSGSQSRLPHPETLGIHGGLKHYHHPDDQDRIACIISKLVEA
jgi:hypothetical protein